MKSLLTWPIKLKNDFLCLIDKNYIEKKLKKRKGKCKKCGKCCGNCKFLDKKTGLCLVYNKRSKVFCYQNFPLSKLDQKVWGVKNCGYKFD
jgi:hypothetical protein